MKRKIDTPSLQINKKQKVKNKINKSPQLSFFSNEFQTLYQYLKDILDKKEKNLVNKIFLKSDERMMTFLTSTFVYKDDNEDEILLNIDDITQNFTQEEVVNQVITNILKNNINSKNILTIGYSKTRPGSGTLSFVYGYQSYFLNTNVNKIKERIWEDLLERIGDRIMTHLLSTKLILISIPNESFLQITGEPLESYLKKSKFSHHYELKKKHYKIKFPIFKNEYNHHENKLNDKLLDLSSLNITLNNSSSNINESPTIISSSTPTTISSITTIPSTISSPTPSLTESFIIPDELNISNFKWKEEKEKKRKRKRRKKLKNETLKQIKISSNSNLISRSQMFYSKNFKTINEFPENHILNKIKSIKELSDYIFTENEIDLNDYPILEYILEKIIENQKKLKNINYLLEKYCPSIHEKELENDFILKTQKEDEYKGMNNDMFKRDDDKSDIDHDDILTNHNDDDILTNEEEDIISSYSTSYIYLMKQNNNYCQVTNFLKSFLKKLIPFDDLFGSNKNIIEFERKLELFICMKKYETFSFEYLIKNIKLNDFNWGKIIINGEKKKDFEIQRNLMKSFLNFIFKDLIIFIIKKYFYITETSYNRRKILYFKRNIWNKISDIARNTLINENEIFKKLKKEEIIELLNNNKLPLSNVRFLPKQKTIRPIINLGKKIKNIKTNQKESTNSILKNTLFILKNEIKKNESNNILGSSIFNSNDIYKKLIPFLKNWNQQSKIKLSQNIKNSKLYFSSVDVKSAYDSIPTQKLFNVISDIFQQDEYVILRFNILRSFVNEVSLKYEREAINSIDYPQFFDFANEILSKKYPKSIFSDQVIYNFIQKDDILNLLENHLLQHIVKIDNEYYHQTIGIPQGSILSPLLCSYFYAHLENHHLNNLSGVFNQLSTSNSNQSSKSTPNSNQSSKSSSSSSKISSPNESNWKLSNESAIIFTNKSSSENSSQNEIGLLLRLIDDFLYVTTSQEDSKNFILQMHQGFSSYGLTINKDKTVVSHPVSIRNGEEKIEVKTMKYIKWCGFIINSENFNFNIDYSRITNIEDQTSKYILNPGLNLVRTLKQTVAYKCSPLILDSTINNDFNIYLNVFQMMCFCSMKFHFFVKSLPFLNLNFLKETIEDLCGYGWIIARSRIKFIEENESFSPLNEKKMNYLTILAFLKIMF
eukprot:gene1649-12774_t